MMLVVANAEGTLWSDATAVARLSSLCAELLRTRSISGCVVPLPAGSAERRRCLAFMQALRRACGGQSIVTVDAASLAVTDLAACSANGVDEAIVRQGGEPAGSALDVVREFRQTHGGERVRLRVWLDRGADGQRFRAASTWVRLLGPGADVTTTPVVIDAPRAVAAEGDTPSAAAPDGVKRPAGDGLACEWLRRAITVHPSGSIVPCALHPPEEGIPLDDDPARIAAQVARWPEVLGTAPLCRRCTLGMRFSTPDWMAWEPPGASNGVRHEEPTPFRDHVGGRLDHLDADAREELVSGLLERLRRGAGDDGARGDR